MRTDEEFVSEEHRSMALGSNAPRVETTADGWLRYEKSGVEFNPQAMHAQAILDKPLNHLRYEFGNFMREHAALVNAQLSQQAADENGPAVEALNFSYWAEKLAELVPADLGDERQLFAREIDKATHAIAHGTTQGAPGGGPNPNSAYRKTLWAMALQFTLVEEAINVQSKAALKQQIDMQTALGDAATEDIDALQAQLDALPARESSEHLQSELVSSSAMRQMKYDFAARAKRAGYSQLEKSGTDATPLMVQFGAPGSWFFNAQKKENPKLNSDLINLDIFWTLLLGDLVDPIFFHEMAHQEKSLFRPEFIEAPRKESKALYEKMKDMVKDGKGDGAIASSPDYQALAEQYLIKKMESTLLHDFWNSTEDNMCDQDNQNQVALRNPPYLWRLDYGINAVRTLIGGVGNYVTGKNKLPDDVSKQTAQDMLASANSAINRAFYIRNHITDDTPEGWHNIGVDIRSIAHKDHPASSAAEHEKAYRDMRELCDAIAYAQPDSSLRSIPSRFKTACNESCTERNALIEELFNHYIEPLFAAAMEAFKEKDLKAQMEDLRQAIEEAKDGVPQPGMGKPGGKGLPIDIEGEGHTIPAPDADNQGAGKNINEGEDAGAIDKPEDMDALNVKAHEEISNPDTPDRKPAPAKNSAPAPAPTPMNGANGRSNGTSALVQLNISDGRSLEELRQDPLYQRAVQEVAKQFNDISKQFPQVAIRMDRHNHTDDFPDAGEFSERFDVEKAMDGYLGEKAGISVNERQHFRRDVTTKIESPGDIFLMIDTSGSMGVGAGSRLEAAVKSAAILFDAARNEQFGVYVSLWGNQEPFMLITPETDEKEMMGALDRAWRMGHQGEAIEGLSGGTELDPPIANMFAHLSLPRSDPAGRDNGKMRSPIHALILSDGDVGSNAGQYMNRALAQCRAVTLDAALTKENQGSDLKRTLNKVATTHLPPHQKPIYVDISNASESAVKMVEWAQTRQQRMLNNLHANPVWDVTNKKLRETAQAAGKQYCNDHMLDWDKTLEVACKQQTEKRSTQWVGRAPPGRSPQLAMTA